MSQLLPRMRAVLRLLGSASRPGPPCCNTAIQLEPDVIGSSAYELTKNSFLHIA